ncbi:MAG: response regulator [Flavobacteriia bacterium]|jgi:DNA-binding response OmpR family regulator
MKTIKKILIVEDELLIAKVLRMQLEEQGFLIDHVDDGYEAYDLITQWQPDLVIMDNYLRSNMTGIEVGAKMRNNQIKTPIIFVTGNSYDNTKLLAKAIGNCSVLGKPILFEELIRLIEEYDK